MNIKKVICNNTGHFFSISKKYKGWWCDVQNFNLKLKKELRQVTCHEANIALWHRHMKGSIHELFHTHLQNN